MVGCSAEGTWRTAPEDMRLVEDDALPGAVHQPRVLVPEVCHSRRDQRQLWQWASLIERIVPASEPTGTSEGEGATQCGGSNVQTSQVHDAGVTRSRHGVVIFQDVRAWAMAVYKCLDWR